MKRQLVFIAITLVVAGLGGVASPAHAEEAAASNEASSGDDASPTEFVRAKADQIISIINRDVEPQTDAAAARKADLRDAIRDFLDFRLLAERTLGAHWENVSEEQREEFISLLRELIETSYLGRLGNEDVNESAYAVDYTNERVRNERAKVEGTVTVDGQERFVEVKLMRKDGGWVIYDVITDDVSLEESYAESFDHIIVEEGWNGLVERMRTRLEELRGEE